MITFHHAHPTNTRQLGLLLVGESVTKSTSSAFPISYGDGHHETALGVVFWSCVFLWGKRWPTQAGKKKFYKFVTGRTARSRSSLRAWEETWSTALVPVRHPVPLTGSSFYGSIQCRGRTYLHIVECKSNCLRGNTNNPPSPSFGWLSLRERRKEDASEANLLRKLC